MTAICILALAAISSRAADFAPPDKAAALEAMKKMVAEAAKAKKTEVWVTLFGSLQKVELVGADAKMLTVKVQGNPFPQNWEKVAVNEIAGIGKNCVHGDAKRALIVADFCMANELREKADEALDLAAQASQTLGAALTDRIKFVKGMAGAAPTVNAAAAAGLGSGGSSSASSGPVDGTPYKAPEKVAFKASEQGYLAPIKEVAAAIDNAIEINLADMGIKTAPLCDDPTFLRRVSLDLTGQIPSPEEVIEFYRAGSGGEKRYKKIEELVNRPDFADHFATFWTVILLGRRTRDNPEVKIAPFKSWLREQFEKNVGFDKIVTQILTATGENDKNGPVNYLTYHMDDTLPNTIGHLTQSFLGARIACAQCHDHPFDKWSQQDFWGFAAFLANTRSERRELREDPKDPMRVTKAWHVLTDQNEKNGGGRYDPPQGDLRLPPKALDGPVFTATAPKKDLGGDLKKGSGKDMKGDMKKPDGKDMAMDKKGDMKGKDMAMDKGMGMDGMMGMGMMGGTKAGADGNLGLQYRHALASWMTDPKNEKFAQSAVNRIWRAMFGYGLVEPVDDIRPKNPASHPEVMKILADDFTASGRDWKRLCMIIANTRAYQRAANGDSSKIDRNKAVRYAARAEVRPMTPEMLFMAIQKATGGEEKSKALLAGLRSRDQAMTEGKMEMMNQDVNEFYGLMQRFINTSTAEDRAGKLQFEGTVAQALMMMHSDFMNRSIRNGVARLQKKGQGDMVYVFAACLGRPPQGPESNAFASFAGGKAGMEGVMWVLLNSAEFVTIH
ncbi:MAG TPA: DUF1549 domain-containing protein [Planctomycetota bacterium]|nr:DUF1549 domain-containing protein [Planctomycetota bacterium]